MFAHHPKGYWYLPGLIYDLAFKIMLRGVRRRVARTVERERLYPWLDVCSGTGDQLRATIRKRAERSVWRHTRSPYRPSPGSYPSSGPANEPRSEHSRQRVQERGLAIGLDLHFGFVRYAAARAPEIPFVCGDAVRLPFKNGSARAVSISFGLHDKDPETRNAIVREARRALGPEGKLIVVDFENPWNVESRVGALFVWAIERLAGGEHYRNGREFLRNGGLRAFLGANGFVEIDRRDVEAGSIGVVTAMPAN
jgi:ubiquinone/menaquinone biosynthesis C-methylase UbiE